jgi:hypothetical protein
MFFFLLGLVLVDLRDGLLLIDGEILFLEDHDATVVDV